MAVKNREWTVILETALSVVLLIWAFRWHMLMYVSGDAFLFHDFGRFYYSAVLWKDGSSIYASNPATFVPRLGIEFWNLSPPHLTLLFVPFAGLPLHRAVPWWWLVSFLCLGWSAILIVHDLRLKGTPWRTVLIAAFALASTPTLIFTATGHLTGPVTLLLTLAWRDLRSERLDRAGVWLGLALSVRVFFLPLIAYLILTARWRAAAIAAATTALCFAIGLAIFGLQAHREWIHAMVAVQWPWITFNASLLGLFTRMATVTSHSFREAPMALATGVGLGLSAVVGLVSLWISTRRPYSDPQWLLLVVTCLWTFPLGWLYYWWIIAGPLVASWRYSAIRRAFWFSLPAWLIPWAFLEPSTSVLHAATVRSLYCWGLGALWVGALVSSLQLRSVKYAPNAQA